MLHTNTYGYSSGGRTGINFPNFPVYISVISEVSDLFELSITRVARANPDSLSHFPFAGDRLGWCGRRCRLTLVSIAEVDSRRLSRLAPGLLTLVILAVLGAGECVCPASAFCRRGWRWFGRRRFACVGAAVRDT